MSIRNTLLEMLTTALPAGISSGTRAIITQNYTEANIKLGFQHEWSNLILGLAGGGNSNTIFVTGALPTILKSTRIGYTGDGLTAYIYETPSYTGGASSPIQNPNAINPVATLNQILTGATITAPGTLIFSPEHSLGSTSQQGKGSAAREVGQEKILKPNTTYLFRITSLDNQVQDVTTALSWYEGALDLPLP